MFVQRPEAFHRTRYVQKATQIWCSPLITGVIAGIGLGNRGSTKTWDQAAAEPG